MHVRRNVADLDPQAIASLRKGVATMKDTSLFPQSDPRSWRFQANIHGTSDTPARPTWNQCQHGSFFFLSWHRMYIYWFERILRAASGDPDLALPYWKWTDQRRLPRPFREPADASTNPLYTSQRAPLLNDGSRQLQSSTVSTTKSMDFPNFSSPPGDDQSFGGQRVTQPAHDTGPHGQLERQPHDGIHDTVEGLMGVPATSARDPIFWLHHAMIDRLWNRWVRRSSSQGNPVGNSVWMDTQFTFFNANGTQVSMSGKDVLDTANQLDYRYDDDPAGSAVRVPFFFLEAELAAAQSNSGDDDGIERTLLGESAVGGEGMIELGAAPKRVPLQLTDQATERVAEVAQAEAVPLEERIVLTVEGVQYYDQNPGVAYEVYLNLPEDQEPDFRSDYYVGNLGFFGTGTHDPEAGGHGGHPVDQSFDLTDVVRALRERGEWREGEATVSFVMRGLEPSEQGAEGFAEQEKEPPGQPRVERVTITTRG
jgi:Common central domain of tyrosinase/Polyphenol oxidase middle domain